MTHNLPLDEGQRQALLMALAHLAVERPGWDFMLSEIAKPIDNETPTGPQLYNEFKRLHLLAKLISHVPSTLHGDVCTHCGLDKEFWARIPGCPIYEEVKDGKIQG